MERDFQANGVDARKPRAFLAGTAVALAIPAMAGPAVAQEDDFVTVDVRGATVGRDQSGALIVSMPGSDPVVLQPGTFRIVDGELQVRPDLAPSLNFTRGFDAWDLISLATLIGASGSIAVGAFEEDPGVSGTGATFEPRMLRVVVSPELDDARRNFEARGTDVNGAFSLLPNRGEFTMYSATLDGGGDISTLGLTLDARTGEFGGTFTGASDVVMNIVASNESGSERAESTFEIDVNRAPVLRGEELPVEHLTVGSGAAVSIDAGGRFEDPDGGDLTYRATVQGIGLVPLSLTSVGLEIDSEGVITGSFLAGADATISIQATDASFESVFGTVTLRVNRPPGESADPLEDKTVSPGMPVIIDVSEGFFDPNGDTLAFSVDFGSNANRGLMFDGRMISGMIETAGSSVAFTVTANDNRGGVLAQSITITAVESNTVTAAGDIIAGDADDNMIDGMGGGDRISGLGGNDTIRGGPGDDIIDGGAGDRDVAVYDGNSGDYILGVERIHPEGGIGEATYRRVVIDRLEDGGDEGFDSLINIEILRFNDREIPISNFDSDSPGDDRASAIIGTASNDEIDGGSTNESIFGRGGDDRISGGGGNDRIYGQSLGGYDWHGDVDTAVYSGGVEDFYFVRDGGEDDLVTRVRDQIIIIDEKTDDLDEGSDLLVGIEVLEFGGGTDTIEIENIRFGGEGSVLMGGDGRDVLLPSGGGYMLTGGGGADIFQFLSIGDSRPSNPTTITDFDGSEGSGDRIALGPNIGAVEVTEEDGDTILSWATEFSTNFRLVITGTGHGISEGNGYYHIGVDTDVSYPTPPLGAGDSAGLQDSHYAGTSGDDTFQGGGGDDLFDGGEGSDTAVYAGDFLDFTFTEDFHARDRLVVTDRNSDDGDEGRDELLNIESIEFADGTTIRVEDIHIGFDDDTFNIVSGTNDVGPELFYGSGGGYRFTGGAGSDIFQFLKYSDSEASNVTIIEDFFEGDKIRFGFGSPEDFYGFSRNRNYFIQSRDNPDFLLILLGVREDDIDEDRDYEFINITPPTPDPSGNSGANALGRSLDIDAEGAGSVQINSSSEPESGEGGDHEILHFDLGDQANIDHFSLKGGDPEFVDNSSNRSNSDAWNNLDLAVEESPVIPDSVVWNAGIDSGDNLF